MGMMTHPTADAGTVDALREAFRIADKPMRQKLVPILPPEIVTLAPAFGSVRMYVDPRDNYTDRMIWRDGQPPEAQSLAALMHIVAGRNALVLDIGANSGAFTVPLAAAAGPGSRVIAFEPSPTMIGRLGYNLRLNNLGEVARIEGCALGDAPGEAILNFRSRNFGQASLMPIRPRLRDGGTLVPVRPLLDFLREPAGHDVSVLKIDVEGAEVAVLKPLLDAASWLPDAMLVETDHADEWDYDLVGRITELGFEVTLEAEQNTLFVR